MILALLEHERGVGPEPGQRVVYDLERDEARAGEVGVAGPALVWTLAPSAPARAVLAREVELDPATEWLLRCDRVDFPPGGVAYRHTHPGPGIRRLLFGELTVEVGGEAATYRGGDAWFESGPEPVLATASATEPTAFVRVLLLPREWEGKRTIRYVDPADEDKPRLQRARIYLEAPLSLPGRATP